MTVAELIAILEEMDGEAEVRIAHQENYPLALIVHGVSTDNMTRERGGHSEDREMGRVGPGEDRVWIVAGGHPDRADESPYAPSGLWDSAIR